MSKKNKLSALVACLCVMAGCSDDKKNETAPAAAKKQPVQQQISTVAPPRAVEFHNVRDPFQALLREEPKKTVSAEAPETVPVERFDAESYRFQAAIITEAGSYALIGDQDGKSHVVRQGSRLGRGGGVISKIKIDYIEIVEKSGLPGKKKSKRAIRLEAPRRLTGG